MVASDGNAVKTPAAADPVFRTNPHHAQFMDQSPNAWNRPVTIEAQLPWDGMGMAQADSRTAAKSGSGWVTRAGD